MNDKCIMFDDQEYIALKKAWLSFSPAFVTSLFIEKYQITPILSDGSLSWQGVEFKSVESKFLFLLEWL